MPKYQVTQEQFDRLINAREQWPDRLEQGWSGDYPGCVLSYLAGIAARGTGDFKPSFPGISKISPLYGIPDKILGRWILSNDLYLFGERRRARKMLRKYERFLKKVEVVSPSETETAESEMQHYVSVQ